MKKIHRQYKILSNERACGRFIRVALDAPLLAQTGQPGQFLNVRVNETLEPFFRRPFGIFHVENNVVDMLIEIRGKGTEMISQKKPGEFLDVLGPLGKSFTPPSEKIKNVVMIAGGIGIAPLLSLAESLKDSGKKLTLLYGARDEGYILDLNSYEKKGCDVCVATDNGSVGKKGNVSVLFDQIPLNSDETFIYTCGPNVMMKSVQLFAKENNLEGECSCEEVMACGIGACLGCAVNTVDGYKTACKDGPVFDLKKVIFD